MTPPPMEPERLEEIKAAHSGKHACSNANAGPGFPDVESCDIAALLAEIERLKGEVAELERKRDETARLIDRVWREDDRRGG